jgi:hypothetical protein
LVNAAPVTFAAWPPTMISIYSALKFVRLIMSKMYRFVRCQPHHKCPDLQVWYLILEPDDVDTLMTLHKGITALYYHKFGLDPYITKSELATFYNPIQLAAQWFQTIESLLFVGITLAINSSGGMIPLDSMKVLAEVVSERLVWPGYDKDEIITISRWPRGRHYHLSSDKNRVFIPAKYNTYESARQMAQKYTDNIQVKGC